MSRWLFIFCFFLLAQTNAFAQRESEFTEKYEEVVVQTQKMREINKHFIEVFSETLKTDSSYSNRLGENILQRSLVADVLENEFSEISKRERLRILIDMKKKSLVGLYGSKEKVKKFSDRLLKSYSEIESLTADLQSIFEDLSSVRTASQSLLLESLEQKSNQALDRINEFYKSIDPRLLDIINEHATFKFPHGVKQIDPMEIPSEKTEQIELLKLQRNSKIRRIVFLSFAFVDLVGITSAFFMNDAVVYTSMIFVFKNMAYVLGGLYLVFEAKAQVKIHQLKQSIDPRVFQLNEVLKKMNLRFKEMDLHMKRMSCAKSPQI